LERTLKPATTDWPKRLSLHVVFGPPSSFFIISGTIGYLGQIDKLVGVPVTTRNWNTIVAIVRILKNRGKSR
jgi:hypothetical protein